MPALPGGDAFRLMRAHVPRCLLVDDPGPSPAADGLVPVDIEILDGTVAAVVPAAAPVPGAVDLAGRMVWPSPVDLHTHLDKAHIWPRAANPDGTFAGALATVERDAPNWSARELRRRMDFALRCAWAHGTAAIRTHLDSTPPQGAVTWPVFAELREAWAGRIGAGLPADLVIFEGRRWSEVLARPESRRTVLRAGRVIEATPPAYAELDDLFA
jgi:cytosine deaminase